MHRQIVSCFVLCGVVLIGVPSVSAQEGDDSPADEGRTIEEVIVTAQRVAESIQDSPSR